MKKIIKLSLVSLIAIQLNAAAPSLTLSQSTITNYTALFEKSGAGNTSDLGNDTTDILTPTAGDNYTADNSDNTIYYTPSTTIQNDIYGGNGNDVILTTDATLEDYYGQYYGQSGNDYLDLPWGGWSEIYGGDGDDTLVGYQDLRDVDYMYIYGGNGDDKIYAPRQFVSNLNRIWGDAGFDTLVVYGQKSDYTITSSGRGRSKKYWLKMNSTGAKIWIKDIEKIIFSTVTPINISGVDTGDTYYWDNSTTLSSTPTATSNNQLTPVTIYVHHFDLTQDYVSNRGGTVIGYINNIDTSITKIKDVKTGVFYQTQSRYLDNSNTSLGQTGHVAIPLTTDGTRELLFYGDKQLTTADMNKIRFTIKMGM